MGKYVTRLKDFPGKPHFAILEFSTIHVPGDQRSKDAPGHGYPAHYESVVAYRAFDDRDEWMAAITKLAQRDCKKEFVAFKAGAPVTITKNIQISEE